LVHLRIFFDFLSIVLRIGLSFCVELLDNLKQPEILY